MELQETITKRHTVRKYKDTLPPKEDIEKIINSARLAPSAKNLQNWMFIAIYNKETQLKIRNYIENFYDKLITSVKDVEKTAILKASKEFAVFFTEAPVVVAIVELPYQSKITEVLEEFLPPSEIKQNKPDSSLLSIGAAIENMILTATELGYGTCWMAAPVMGSPEYKKLLDITDDERIVSLLTIGISDEDNHQYSAKKSLNDVMKVIN